MPARLLCLDDVRQRRLDDVFTAELAKTPAWAVASLDSFYAFAKTLAEQRAVLTNAVSLVVDNGQRQLPAAYFGIAVDLPYYESGKILSDQFLASRSPAAMMELVSAVETAAQALCCHAFTMGCMSTRPAVTERWGRRLGLSPLTLTLVKEV